MDSPNTMYLSGVFDANFLAAGSYQIGPDGQLMYVWPYNPNGQVSWSYMWPDPQVIELTKRVEALEADVVKLKNSNARLRRLLRKSSSK